jgi:SPX domain protein involved in polyphosphate accumulation
MITSIIVKHHNKYHPYLLIPFDPFRIKSIRAQENDRLDLLYQTSYKTSRINESLPIESSKIEIVFRIAVSKSGLGLSFMK